MPRKRPDPDKKSKLPTIAPDTTCNGIVRSGLAYCRQPAGANTDHRGQGRCKLHGGANPVKHGRYSTVKSTALRDLIRHFDADPDLLNIEREVSVLRAIWVDWVNRYAEWRDALLAWHESFTDPDRETEPKPRQVLDLADGYRIVAEVTKAVERIERIRAANAISRPEFGRVMAEMGRVVEAHVRDPQVLEKIRDGWLAIRVG